MTSGVTMALYAQYNLSLDGKHFTSDALEFLSFMGEAFCFAYLGLTFFSYSNYDWSLKFFLVMLVIVILGRFLGTVVFLQSLRIFGHTPLVSLKEVTFMSLAGMIRGAIAFGLVLRLDDSLPNKKVIVTTSLSLVCGTVVFFGSFLGFIGDAMFKNDGKKEVKTGINEELLDGEEKKEFS